jgi:glycerate kinase
MAEVAPLRVLVAPDSFKGTFTSVEVARSLAAGWTSARPADVVSMTPMADGGEGTLHAIAASGGWDVHPAAARDALMQPIESRFLRDGDRAVVEMAAASGLARIAPAERDAMAATTFGTGQILAAAIGLGCRRIVIGLGGSATTDGGAGLLAALGARLTDAAGDDLAPGGGALADLAHFDLSGLPEVLQEVSIVVASDVTNPLLGELGAAATYGPQKGASLEQVLELDRNLGHYADVTEAALGRSMRDEPGSGAAGGTTFGLLAIADRFSSFDVGPGVDVVMELTGFHDRLEETDLVLTGEGQVDAQTAHGKTAMGVATRAADKGLRTICFGGGVTPEGYDFMASLGVVAVPVIELPMTVEESAAAGTAPIFRAAERIARVIDLAGEL